MNFHENYFKLQFVKSCTKLKSFKIFSCFFFLSNNFEYENIGNKTISADVTYFLHLCVLGYELQEKGFWIVLEPFIFFFNFFSFLFLVLFGDWFVGNVNQTDDIYGIELNENVGDIFWQNFILDEVV